MPAASRAGRARGLTSRSQGSQRERGTVPEAGQDILTLDERFFARIALKNGLLSETDLALATRDRVASGRPLEQILRARGLLTDAQLAKVREAQVASQVVRL